MSRLGGLGLSPNWIIRDYLLTAILDVESCSSTLGRPYHTPTEKSTVVKIDCDADAGGKSKSSKSKRPQRVTPKMSGLHVKGWIRGGDVVGQGGKVGRTGKCSASVVESIFFLGGP